MSDRSEPTVDLLEGLEGLESIRREWDELAVSLDQPFAAPGWLLAWSNHVAPGDALFRAVAYRDRGRLVALIPLWAERRAGVWRYRNLGAPGMALRGAYLVAPDVPPAAVRALGAAIGSLSPRPASVVLSQIDAPSPVPAQLAEGWGARLGVARRETGRAEAPVVHLDPRGFDAWVASRSKNFRGQIRRKKRRALDAGGVVTTVAEGAALAGALAAFDRLHRLNWGRRSTLTTPGARAMLHEAAVALEPSSRLRVATVSIGDEIVSADVFVAAGSRAAFWNGGWDPSRSSLSPGFVALAAAVEDAHGNGESSLDLGEGNQAYKMRFADDRSPIVSVELRPRGWRWLPLAIMEDVPARARRAVRAISRSMMRDRPRPATTGDGR